MGRLVLQQDFRWHDGLSAGDYTFGANGYLTMDGSRGRIQCSRKIEPRKHIVAARDRSGRDIDRIRCVRTEDYKYIRNFNPRKPWFEPTNYTYTNRVSSTMRQLHEEGKLNKVQSRFLNPERPAEELYDLRADPYETINLASLLRAVLVIPSIWSTLLSGASAEGNAQRTTSSPGACRYTSMNVVLNTTLGPS